MSETTARLVSPNQLLEAAREHMLDGREAETRDDWVLVMNFMANNVDAGCAESACLLLSKIYGMPLEDDEVREIVAFQLERR